MTAGHGNFGDCAVLVGEGDRALLDVARQSGRLEHAAGRRADRQERRIGSPALLAQRTQVLQRQKELQVELSSLRQLRRIEDIAAQHLGLRPPQATQVIYVRSGQQAVGQRRP